MKFLHSMVRVSNLDNSLKFYCDLLGLEQVKKQDYPEHEFTLVFLKAPGSDGLIELTYNYGDHEYDNGRNFGHLAFEVENIYEKCQFLMDNAVEINRPPRDGRMAFIKSPDNISIELLQKGGPLEIQEPWKSMANIGQW